MFSWNGEFFISIFKMNKEGNFVISVRIGSINEEPLGSVFIILDGVFDIFLKGLTLNIVRIGTSDKFITFNSHE
jgi:hypothetical protein